MAEVVEAEAQAALELLRLDADDSDLQERMMRNRKGRCYMRDFEGRAVPMQVDPGPSLLAALDTTPKRAEEAVGGGELGLSGDAVGV